MRIGLFTDTRSKSLVRQNDQVTSKSSGPKTGRWADRYGEKYKKRKKLDKIPYLLIIYLFPFRSPKFLKYVIKIDLNACLANSMTLLPI